MVGLGATHRTSASSPQIGLLPGKSFRLTLPTVTFFTPGWVGPREELQFNLPSDGYLYSLRVPVILPHGPRIAHQRLLGQQKGFCNEPPTPYTSRNIVQTSPLHSN